MEDAIETHYERNGNKYKDIKVGPSVSTYCLENGEWVKKSNAYIPEIRDEPIEYSRYIPKIGADNVVVYSRKNDHTNNASIIKGTKKLYKNKWAW